MVLGLVLYSYKDIYKKYFSFMDEKDEKKIVCDGNKCMIVPKNTKPDDSDNESNTTDSTYESNSMQSFSLDSQSNSLSGGSFLSQDYDDNMSYGSMSLESENLSNLSDMQSSFFND